MGEPITRVLDEDNKVVHDCAEVGCSVSWDGIALVDHDVDDLYPDERRRPPDAKPIRKGEPMPGRRELPETATDHGNGTATTRK